MKNYSNWSDLNVLATKSMNKFGVFISNNLDTTPEDDKAWNAVVSRFIELFGMGTPEYFDYIAVALADGMIWFDTLEDAYIIFDIFNEEPVYSSGLFAALYCPIRGCINENT